MTHRRRQTYRLARAVLAVSLVPGLILGRSGVLPCPHMAAGMDMDMPMGMSMAVAPGMSMGVTPGASTGVPRHAASDDQGPQRHPPLGHVPCDCPDGCPGAAPVEAPPVATLSFSFPQVVATFAGFPEPVAHAPAPVPHLLPFALGPPRSL